MMLRLFLVGLSLLVFSNVAAAEEKIMVCYYGTWATWRTGLGKFDVDHIDVSLCTHLIYTFVGIDDKGTVISLDPYLDFPDEWGRDNFGKFNALKEKNPKLKTLLAVGGWNEGSAKYSEMVADPKLREHFITSAMDMVRTYGFDGLDLDWEYPNQRDSVHGKADVDNFSQLVKELREAFDPYGLLLTAAVSAVKKMASQSYDIPVISKYLDIINIMTYDMYGDWDPVTGHNAPLYRGEGDEDKTMEDAYTVEYAVKYWLDQGCPPEKLALGLPLYGRTFTLSNAKDYGVRAAASGAGIGGPYTDTPGFIGYNEFCSKLQSESWDIYFDDLARVPYAVQDKYWVSFDTPESLVEKAKFGLSLDIAGLMVWSIETDDFHGNCLGESFPLLRALKRALGSAVNPNTTTATPTSTSPSSTSTNPATTTTQSSTSSSSSTTTTAQDETTPKDEPSSVCTKSGFVPDPDDCASFYQCVNMGDGQFAPYKFTCPSDLVWDKSSNACNFRQFAQCDA